MTLIRFHTKTCFFQFLNVIFPGKLKSKQNITRDTEVKNNLTIARVEWGEDSEERGLQKLL